MLRMSLLRVVLVILSVRGAQSMDGADQQITNSTSTAVLLLPRLRGSNASLDQDAMDINRPDINATIGVTSERFGDNVSQVAAYLMDLSHLDVPNMNASTDSSPLFLPAPSAWNDSVHALDFALVVPPSPPSPPAGGNDKCTKGVWACGLETGDVDYGKAAESVGPIVDGITHFTGKVAVPADAKNVIDGIAQIAAGLGPLMMSFAAATGPAAPWVFAAGAAVTAVSGVLSNLFEGPSGPSLSDAIQEGFGQLNIRIDALESRLQSLCRDAKTSLKLLKELKSISLKILFREEDEFFFLAAQLYDDLLMLTQESKEQLIKVFESDHRVKLLAEGLSRSRYSAIENLRQAKESQGTAAAVLRFHDAMTARMNTHMVLWTLSMLKGEYLRAKILQEDLSEDLVRFKQEVDAMHLGPWLSLNLGQGTGQSLQPYLQATNSAEWDAVQDVKSRSCGNSCSASCNADIVTLTKRSALVVTAVTAIPQLADMLRCDVTCLAAAKALQKIGLPAAQEAWPALESAGKGSVQNCIVWVFGKQWRAWYTQGNYNLHAYTSQGARDDEAQYLQVFGSGCSVAVYKHQDYKHRLGRFTYDGQKHSLPGGISSIIVGRYQEDCIYQAKKALYQMGASQHYPSRPTIPRQPEVKTVCQCSFRCKYNSKSYSGWIAIRESEWSTDCTNTIFVMRYNKCRFGIKSAWSCKWTSFR